MDTTGETLKKATGASSGVVAYAKYSPQALAQYAAYDQEELTKSYLDGDAGAIAEEHTSYREMSRFT